MSDSSNAPLRSKLVRQDTWNTGKIQRITQIKLTIANSCLPPQGAFASGGIEGFTFRTRLTFPFYAQTEDVTSQFQ